MKRDSQTKDSQLEAQEISDSGEGILFAVARQVAKILQETGRILHRGKITVLYTPLESFDRFHRVEWHKFGLAFFGTDDAMLVMRARYVPIKEGQQETDSLFGWTGDAIWLVDRSIAWQPQLMYTEAKDQWVFSLFGDEFTLKELSKKIS
jgi:hypothetical protein